MTNDDNDSDEVEEIEPEEDGTLESQEISDAVERDLEDLDKIGGPEVGEDEPDTSSQTESDNGREASAETPPSETEVSTSEESGAGARTSTDVADPASETASSGGTTPTESTGTDTSTSADIDSSERRERGKWLLIGIGGCGNNLIDAIHLRKTTLDDAGNPAFKIWDSGIQGTVSTNTNRTELRESYYAKEIYDGQADEFALSHKFPGEGAGENESKGARYAEQGFEEGMYDQWEEGSKKQIRSAQAVMLLHSAVQGTGSGATPVVAENLRDDLPDDAQPHLYSSVVLPERREDYLLTEDGHLQNPGVLQNATVCLSRLSEYADVIIPFTNSKLQGNNAQVELDGAKNYFDRYISENQSLVSYLEAFSLSSIPTTNEIDIKGSGKFDVYDPIGPIEDLNPQGYSSEEKPATLFAPAHTTTVRKEFSVNDLRRLLEMLVANPLAEFNPLTAWGAALMFYGPEERIKSVERVGRRHLLEQAIDVFDIEPGFNFELSDHYIIVPTMDKVHLWAGFWNPEMEIIDDCVHHAQNEIEDGSNRGKRIEGFETNLQNLQNNLGRDAFK